MLALGLIRHIDQERLAKAVLEMRGFMQVVKIGVSLKRKTFSTPHDLIARKTGTFARKKLYDVYPELLCALIYKSKGKVHVATLTGSVLLLRTTCGFCHLGNGKVVVLTQRTNAICHVSAIVYVNEFHNAHLSRLQ